MLLPLLLLMAQPQGFNPPPPTLPVAIAEFLKIPDTADSTDRYRASIRLETFVKSHPPDAADRRLLLQAAASTPENPKGWDDPGRELVALCSDSVSDTDIELIKTVFPRLSRHAKVAALELLTLTGSTQGADAYVNLALAAAKDHAIDQLPFGRFINNSARMGTLLPRLLEVAAYDNGVTFSLFEVILSWSQRAMIKVEFQPAVMKTSVDTCLRETARIRELEKLEAPSDAARLELQRLSANLTQVVDLLGYLEGQDGVAALHDAATLKSPDLRLWAACSLLQKSQKVPPEDLAAIAADVSRRYTLLQTMKQKGVDDRFPKDFRTNQLLAESNFYNWLCSGFELGHPPAALELGKLVTISNPGEDKLEYFVFRFKEDAKPASPWKVGVSGPFRAGEFDYNGGSETTSAFELWKPEEAEAQVQRIQGKLKEPKDQPEEKK